MAEKSGIPPVWSGMGMGGKKEFAARKMEMSLTDGLAYDYPYFWVFFYQVTDSQITHQWSLKNRKQAISVQYYDKGAQHHTVEMDSVV
ncbi:hypothetical protein BHE90_007610 [Fusarium euwallaceae]|uniref:Uncharacterized protein n=2 Tax=Fusarium solani species complex TaxID=232080 RepID=A0A428UPN7_9HYPO|nr:hypothetical protein CEP52_000317 [Fusarium oligoseptatum]RTE77884.1 hypothetical protein BHE90_007610 [Fusarium euwallaceae]